MGYFTSIVNVNYYGPVCRISPGTSESDFIVSKNGVDVTDPAILGALYGASEDLSYLEQMTRGGGRTDITFFGVDAATLTTDDFTFL